jgi:DNA-binding response OmpR family regulator
MYICLLEDEPALSEQVVTLLTSLGHRSCAFADGKDAIRALRTETFDLFILDWHVPGATGVEVLEHIRKVRQLDTPVLFLTSRTEEQDLVTVFEMGADDYCTKPLKARELSVRIEALLRRSYPATQLASKRRYAGYTFDSGNQTVSVDELQISLSEKEFKLALILFDNMDRAIARKRLVDEVWGGAGDALSRTLDVHISWLRKKLDLGATSKTLYIKSIHGHGYRLSTR